MVFPEKSQPDKYLIVDGHVRPEALKQLGHTQVPCLIATDDEAYTYNKQINGLSPIQEHVMILKAIKNGVSEQRIPHVSFEVYKSWMKEDLKKGDCLLVSEGSPDAPMSSDNRNKGLE